jgi:alkanesulfonate monooxygenase SsuD/methylene tetrahydromethanopterin reductase-like flavin-dependent oxidoreductase (luciferase family)
MALRVAFTMDFRNAPQRRRPWREFWEDNLWLMCQAEVMGFDTLQVQEHFFTDDGYGPSLPVFLSVLAERTSRVRLMAYIYVLPLRNPAQLAQETLVLDHLCEGRLDVGVGIGHRAVEYRAFDIDPKTRGARMEEGLEILKLAWTTRPFTYQGRFYSFDEVEVRPEPFQDPHPPLWVGATTPKAAERAGRHGAHLALGSGDLTVVNVFKEAYAGADLDPGSARINFGLAAWPTFEDPDAVWDRSKDLYRYQWDFYRKIRAELGDPDLAPPLPGSDPIRSFAVITTPEEIIEHARQVVDIYGITDFGWSGPPTGVPPRTEGYAAMKLFAEKVLPEIHSW